MTLPSIHFARSFKTIKNRSKILSLKVEFNPVSGSQSVEIPENEYVTYFNLDELEQLLNCIRYGTGLTKGQLAVHDKYKKRDLAIIFLFLDTGLRISER